MIVSMTAYGRAEKSSELGQASCEIRSVNHRYLEMSVRLPEELRALEQTIRERISAKLKRGRIDCNIRFDFSTVASDSIPVNTELLNKLIERAESTATQLQQAQAIDPLELLGWPGVLDKDVPDPEKIGEMIMALINETLQAIIATRQREGEKIRSIILERTGKTRLIVQDLQQQMPSIIAKLKNKLSQRANELCQELDNDRLEQEVVLLSQKLDVAEEIDRLLAHIEEVERVLNQSSPAGRRLDFLMQEMNREANTLGSKSAHIDTSNASVDLKVYIEQMREQIQNIE